MSNPLIYAHPWCWWSSLMRFVGPQAMMTSCVNAGLLCVSTCRTKSAMHLWDQVYGHLGVKIKSTTIWDVLSFFFQRKTKSILPEDPKKWVSALIRGNQMSIHQGKTSLILPWGESIAPHAEKCLALLNGSPWVLENALLEGSRSVNEIHPKSCKDGGRVSLYVS